MHSSEKPSVYQAFIWSHSDLQLMLSTLGIVIINPFFGTDRQVYLKWLMNEADLEEAPYLAV
jgi:hypothetical protein